MTYPRIRVALFLALLAPMYATTKDAEKTSGLVEFSSRLGDSTLTIECAPRSEGIAKRDDWVDQCNDLGRAALDSAAESSQIAPVDGLAFGMASQFIRRLPASAGIQERTMSREIPLLEKSS